MSLPAAADAYRDFHIRKINQPEYRHIWLLLIWPLYGLRYLLVEQLNPAAAYMVVSCPMDAWIPFQEWFLIPYVLWYGFIIGMHLYTLIYDVEAYLRYSKFLLIAMFCSTAAFLLIPTCQQLRPEQFPRDNLLTKVVGLLYRIDTNTNVCPSEHVIISIGVWICAWNTRGLNTPRRRAEVGTIAVLICLSTLFLKQHSVVDLLAALPVCAVAWWFTRNYRSRKNQDNNPE